MQIKAEEISKIIEDQIKNYEQRVEMSETGTVLYVGDGIARVYGAISPRWETCLPPRRSWTPR